MDFLEITRAHYESEFSRKRDLNTGVSLSVTLATALAAGLLALIAKAEPIFTLWGAATFAASASAGIALVFAVTQLLLSHVGHAFSYVGSIEQFRLARVQDRKNGTPQTQVDVSTTTTLTREYAQAAERNQNVNDRKSLHLHRANVCLAWAVLFTIAAATLVVASSVEAKVASQYKGSHDRTGK